MRNWAVDPKLMILSEWSLSDVTEGTQRLSQVSEIIPRCFVRSSWTGSLVFVPLQTCGRQDQVSVLSGSKTRQSFQEAVSTGLIYDLCIECPPQSFWMLEWLWDLCYFFFSFPPQTEKCVFHLWGAPSALSEKVFVWIAPHVQIYACGSRGPCHQGLINSDTGLTVLLLRWCISPHMCRGLESI